MKGWLATVRLHVALISGLETCLVTSCCTGCRKPSSVTWRLPYLLTNAGSSQLSCVLPGDVLWIVTTGESHSLGLAGRLRVGEIVTLMEARRRLLTDDLWPSPYHALAQPGTAELM